MGIADIYNAFSRLVSGSSAVEHNGLQMRAYGGEAYPWPEKLNVVEMTGSAGIPDMYYYEQGRALGWVRGISIEPIGRGGHGKTAVVRHIATDEKQTRRRLGTDMARELFRQLNARYRVATIDFREDKFPGSPHDLFFRFLGAEYDPFNGTKPAWIWTHAACQKWEEAQGQP